LGFELTGSLAWYGNVNIMLIKFRSEKKWTLQAIEQLSEEDITSSPTLESNSIANLVAHISGAVHSRIETILLGIPDTRDRDKEFEKGQLVWNYD
jgi:hypothetical protein